MLKKFKWWWIMLHKWNRTSVISNNSVCGMMKGSSEQYANFDVNMYWTVVRYQNSPSQLKNDVNMYWMVVRYQKTSCWDSLSFSSQSESSKHYFVKTKRQNWTKEISIIIVLLKTALFKKRTIYLLFEPIFC